MASPESAANILLKIRNKALVAILRHAPSQAVNRKSQTPLPDTARSSLMVGGEEKKARNDGRSGAGISKSITLPACHN